MIADKNRVFDGWVSLEGGVDAGRSAEVLDPNQVESARNISFRGGKPTTRPGFRKLAQNFLTPDMSYDSQGNFFGDQPGSSQSALNYQFSIMQCAHVYNPHQGNDMIMALIGGRLYKIIPRVTTCDVTELPLPPRRNRATIPMAYMVQADKWFLAQDGESKPIIYDGSTVRRAINTADPNKTEVPVGTMMAYGMGRVCVIVGDRNIAFGDLYGSHPEFTDPADSLILFTERNFLAEGFDAAIPFEQGVATGIAFFPQLDTSTGNGQLLVFSERGANAFFLSLDRSQWKTSQFQILALVSTGARGHRTIAPVNEDLWFRADDGVRTFRQARSEQYGWAHIPVSTNVRQFVDNDSTWLLKYGSGIYFDNRYIMTASPVWNQFPQSNNPWTSQWAGTGRPQYYATLVVDFDILSSFGARFKPAWEGNWVMPYTYSITPWNLPVTQLFSGLFNGVNRAFAFGMAEDGSNQLYEITTGDIDDWDYQRIDWELVSRDFGFVTGPTQNTGQFAENELYDADIWLTEISE